MNSEFWASILGVVVTVGGGFLHLLRRIDRIEFRVDTIWDFQIRRAKSEARSRGMFRTNSPSRLAPDMIRHFETFEKELIAYYEQRGRYLSDRELFIDIEKLFGDKITESVSLPLGLTQGSGILAAAYVAARGDISREMMFSGGKG